MPVIEVLGPGCPNCRALERNVRQALAARGLVAEIRHVTEWSEIAARGVISTPGLVIDGRLFSAGRIPTPDQVAAWLPEPVTPGPGA
jgi:small redox-active disulfide protein 2